VSAFEAIKSLRPADRFYALMFVVFITTGSAVLTSYLQTDDCKGLSDQYTALIENHTEIMKINNDLLSANNQKKRDLMKIMVIIDSMSNVNRTVVIRSKTYTDNSNRQINPIIDENDATPLAMSRPPEITIEKTEKTTTIHEVPDKQKSLINNLKNIVDKYKKGSDK